MSYTYDNVGRQSTMSVQNGASGGTTTTIYGYDALSRLNKLTSPAGEWNYAYAGNTNMVQSLTKPNGTVTNYSYDGLNRLTQVQNQTSTSSILSKYVYAYDNHDVRTSMERTMGNSPMQHIDYSYDSTNQLTGEVASEAQPLNNVPYVNNGFAYDAMGNRSTFGSSQLPSGGNTTSQITSTVVNRLNQLTSQTLTTSVNGVPSSTRTDSFNYDLNGNLDTQSTSANSSGTSYVYDEADRLTQIVQKDGNGVNSQKSEFVYDGIGRKIISREYSWNGSAWQLVPNSEVRRIYDGMDVVQERDANNNVLVNYTRDGNIGGIQAKTNNTGSNYFYNYDGSGNVTQLTDSSQNSVAEYTYDAYGNTLRAFGNQAAGNIYRFSTKELHSESGLYGYGFRFYSPSLGRWLNKDPIGERGGINLYVMVGNDPINYVDYYGMHRSHYGYDSHRYRNKAHQVQVEANPISWTGQFYGYYCGGQWGSPIDGRTGKRPTPCDSLDRCCMIHDDCFARYGCTAVNQFGIPNCKSCNNSLSVCADQIATSSRYNWWQRWNA